MEDHGPIDRRRLSPRRGSGRCRGSGPHRHHPDIVDDRRFCWHPDPRPGDLRRDSAAVDFSAAHPLYRLGLLPRRRQAYDMKIRYFAWVRERIGKTEEDIDPPAGVATVGDLM